jgi:hypothetical protein
VVRDHAKRDYYFFTAFNSVPQRVSLAEIEWSDATAGMIPVVQPAWFQDVTPLFHA